MSISYTDATGNTYNLKEITDTDWTKERPYYISDWQFLPSDKQVCPIEITYTYTSGLDSTSAFTDGFLAGVFAIKKVIFNPPATVVYWKDGTKTVVKAVNETFDPEKGLAMAITKKALGNKGNYYNAIRKWIDIYKPEPEVKEKIVTATTKNGLDDLKDAVVNFDELVKSSIKALAENIEKFGGTKNGEK